MTVIIVAALDKLKPCDTTRTPHALNPALDWLYTYSHKDPIGCDVSSKWKSFAARLYRNKAFKTISSNIRYEKWLGKLNAL